jgi:hypothetical protein
MQDGSTNDAIAIKGKWGRVLYDEPYVIKESFAADLKLILLPRKYSLIGENSVRC